MSYYIHRFDQERETRQYYPIEDSTNIFVVRPVPVFSERETLLEEFDNFRSPNWDGEGAEPITGRTLENARGILRRLPGSMRSPDAAPGTDGSIGLIWEINGAYVYLDIKANGAVHYYYQIESRDPVEDVLPSPFNAEVLLSRINEPVAYIVRHRTTHKDLNISSGAEYSSLGGMSIQTASGETHYFRQL